ncbi:hypothetical protein BJP43_05785 [Candidatus Williamhamiltonella defendens]|uniref:Uncharacterized protein n=2 Tax=Candidatus Williamhamiltonella defendens TaxID=138072 RepID=A0A2D3TDJ3_9ENTR|nr:hypothetical protein BJP43_05785 [Candidatus Hamiltonella defensa]
MTFRQIVREMGKLSDFDTHIEEGQLTKLLQHHAQQMTIKIEGKKERPWVLIEGKKLNNKEIREALTKCGL